MRRSAASLCPVGSLPRQRAEAPGPIAGHLTRSREVPSLVPRAGAAGLEGVRFALVLPWRLLMETAGDHLIRHRLGDAQLRQRLDLIGHHLVTGGLDRG